MTREYLEKISHIKDLIDLSEVNGPPMAIEEDFISRVASRIGISTDDLGRVRQGGWEVPFAPPKYEYQRIPQFHRLLLLMVLQRRFNPERKSLCFRLAFRMGLNPLAVLEILHKIEGMPGYVITPDEITETFKKYYN